MVRLLDINILLALAWPAHKHHGFAHNWFARNQAGGWATCPMTQAGFVRLSINPNVSESLITAADAVEVLEDSMATAEHVFWSQTARIDEMSPEIRSRIMGAQQLSDAVLLELAIRNGGVLATLDQRISHLLAPGSSLRKHLEIISLNDTESSPC